MNPKNLQSEIESLYRRQLENWPDFSDAVKALGQIQAKTIIVDGSQIQVQNNPARIRSTAAKVDPKSLAERPCFLCKKNRPTEQEELGILAGKYVILVNPFPVLPMHFTVVRSEHVRQDILQGLEDFLSLAIELGEKSVLIFNGARAGASAPDHLHFQIIPSLKLPIFEHFSASSQEVQKLQSVVPFAGANYIFLSSSNKQSLTQALNKTMESIQKSGDANLDFINLISWSNGESLFVILAPRTAHRPSCFFAEGQAQIMVSPAAVELSGVWVLPRAEDYAKVTVEVIKSVHAEVCYDFNGLNKFLS